MFFRLSFVTLLLALLALGTPVKRDASQVESDIKSLTSKSQTLDVSIKAFPNSGATIKQAMAIHNAAIDLISATETATDHVKASPEFTDAQANSILNLIENLVPVVKTSCSDLEAKKAAIKSANAQGIAEADLKRMKEVLDEYETQFMPKLPADMQSNGQVQFSEADTALEGAINTYETQ